LNFVSKYSHDMQAGRNHLENYKTSIITTEYGPIEYIRRGSGFPLLISHGITGGFDQGLSLAATYIGGGYDTIAPSRFGYLGTPLPKDGNPKVQADAYKCLLDKLDIEKAIVFGNSAGGTSAIRFALQHPDRCEGLILLSSTVPPNPSMPPKPIMQMVFGFDFIYWLTVTVFGRLMLSMFLPRSVRDRLTGAEIKKIMQDIFKSAMPITKRTKGIINDMFVSNPDINTGYQFDTITVPTLIIHDVDDPAAKFSGAESMAKQIPNSRLERFEGGGHLLIGHEEIIKQLIQQFTNELLAHV